MKKTLLWNIEYAVYCRKSTDESSGKQTSSIPQQIQACVQYAEREKLRIKIKPENFEFETEAEIVQEEDNDPNIEDRRIYAQYKNLYIIRERKSAKEPGERPKWRKLMQLVRKGEIKGIISYSPDRQSRNLLEAGELIDLVDKEMVDLGYPNFTFEPNAAGKMMLGIWFVFSKQYSDKLWEDSSRWSEEKVKAGKAIWKIKYGYGINDEGYHYPHPEHFRYMQEAFRIKIEEDRSDAKLADWLRSKWVGRTYLKNDKKSGISARILNDIWKDPFYYWVFEYWDIAVDLRDKNPHYEPMITKEEYDILIQRYYGNQPYRGKKESKEEHIDLMPFEEKFILTTDGSFLSFNVPNKQRFYAKLEKLRKTKPHSTLRDVVNSNQIYFNCVNKKSDFNGFSITFDQIEDLVIEKLKTFQIDERDYEEYRIFMQGKFQERCAEISQNRRILQRNINDTTTERNEYIRRNAAIKKDVIEQEVYDNEKKRYQLLIDNMELELQKLKNDDRNELIEFEAFFDMLNNTNQYYAKANNVQKRMISKILFSNILVTNEKTLQIQVKPGLEGLFSKLGSATENRTPVDGMKIRCPNH